MKTLTLEYESKQQLRHFVTHGSLCNGHNILIQVFTGVSNKKFILDLRDELVHLIPNAKIIGSTTCGEISNNGSKTDSTVISFSLFKQTKIETNLVEYSKSSFTTGQNTIKSFDNYMEDDLKLIITFTDGLNTNGEEYLNGISSINNKTTISGGMAGDNAKFEETLVFNEKSITNNGAVAAALYNKDLNIYTGYSFNWETIGRKHIVENSYKNRVYRIGGMTTLEFYKYYLGDDIGRLLPAIGIEFPLVIKKDDVTVARAVLAKHDDGSLSFAGNIPQGSVVQFGHGDVKMIVNKGLDNVKEIINHPIESIFIYSCMARRALLQNDVNLELLPLRELAPISGFFTYGEFYHSCKNNVCNNQLLNQTMTLLAISEKQELIEKITPNIFSQNPPKVNESALHRTQALSILIEKTTKELEDLNNKLEIKIENEVSKNIEKDAVMQVMKTQAQLGDMIEMIIHQWRQPLSAITSTTTSVQVYKSAEMLTDNILNESLDNILSYTEHLNTTIGDFRDLFILDNKSSSITLSNLMEKALSIINPLIKKEGIEVIKEFDSDSKILIPIGLMMQVLLNIIKNAIDIIVERKIQNPKIKFKTYVEKESCTINIMDNAGGIPADILPHIFDKKFTTKSHSHGTGLGLDMSKTIVENKVDGELTAYNIDGWAVFSIKIPI